MEIEWSAKAQKAFLGIQRGNPKLAAQIYKAIGKFAKSGTGDIDTVKGSDGATRLRVRTYRVVVKREGDTLVIVNVGKRSEIYRDL